MIYDGNANQRTSLAVCFSFFFVSRQPGSQWPEVFRRHAENGEGGESHRRHSGAGRRRHGGQWGGWRSRGQWQWSGTMGRSGTVVWYAVTPARWRIHSQFLRLTRCSLSEAFSCQTGQGDAFPPTFRHTSASSLRRYSRFVCTAVQYILTSRHSTLEEIKTCFQHLDF